MSNNVYRYKPPLYDERSLLGPFCLIVALLYFVILIKVMHITGPPIVSSLTVLIVIGLAIPPTLWFYELLAEHARELEQRYIPFHHTAAELVLLSGKQAHIPLALYLGGSICHFLGKFYPRFQSICVNPLFPEIFQTICR